MKKSLLIGLTLSSTLLLAACGNKEAPAIQPENINTGNTSEVTVLPDNNELTMTCPEAIQTYLTTANLEGEGDATVQAGNNITVDYIGRFADGTIFDTSVEKVAQACGVYTSQRNYNEGLTFDVGTQPPQMIEGFDKAVLGMKLHQTKTVNIPAAEAYGEYNPEFQLTSSTEGMDVSGFTEGVQIMTQNGPAIITKITDNEITLDFNHELAGKELIFDITIKSINS